MKKFLIFIVTIICIVGITFAIVTPISPEDSLNYQFKLLQSEYLDDICEKMGVNINEEVKKVFADSNIVLTDEEAERVVTTLLAFDYEIESSVVYDTYADVSVTVVTVDTFGLVKEKIKANIGDIILGVLTGNQVSNEAILKEVLVELDSAPKSYMNTVNVRVNDVKGIFYLLDFENNNDLYNALSGGLLYELEMLEQ